MNYFNKMHGTTTSPPRVSLSEVFWSWIGAFLGIGAVAFINYNLLSKSDLIMLIGSFGASAVLIYGAIKSPLAQPRNLLGGHVLDQVIHNVELRHRGHVKAGTCVKQSLDDGGVRVGLHRIVGLDAGQVFFKGGIVPAENLVIDHKKRRSVFLPELFKHVQSIHAGDINGSSRICVPKS